MRIVINGEHHEMEDEPITVEKLLHARNVTTPEMVSVQMNGVYVKREMFSQTLVQENDEVEFLYFMGGGSG